MVPFSLLEDVESVVRAVSVKSPSDVMLFLGAGASVSSGIPSAWQCTWQFKQRLFLTAHSSLDRILFSDITDPQVQARIQKWLDARSGMPPVGSCEEYGYFVEQCYPRPEDRRKFFEGLSQVERPSLGYRALGRMLEHGHFRWLWTTNFDNLIQRGLPEGAKRPLRIMGLDSTTRLRLIAERNDYANLVHLHGDYRYDSLLNTSPEIQALDSEYVSAIGELARDLPMVVIGYGGGDRSVMTALKSAYARSGTGAIYWITLRGKDPSPEVVGFIEMAAAQGHHARLVESDGFDDLMLRLAQLLLPSKEHAGFVNESHEKALRPATFFSLAGYPGRVGVAKSNLWEISLPETYWRCECPQIESWKQLREVLVGKSVVAGLHRGSIVALGSPSELAHALSLKLELIRPSSFEERDLEEGTIMQGVIAEYVARSLAGKDFITSRSHGNWSVYNPKTVRFVAGSGGFKVADSAMIMINFKGHAPVLALVPDRQILSPVPGQDPPDFVRARVTRELSRQWNKTFNEELARWRHLFGLIKTDRQLVLGDCANGSQLAIRRGPQFVELLSPDSYAQVESVVPLEYLTLQAIQLPEPKLRFGDGVDAHPLRGIIERGPVESRLPRLDGGSLRLGICCPSSVRPEAFFAELLGGHQTIESRDDYLLPYPGFQKTFGLELRLGTPAGGGWLSFDTKLPGGTNEAQQAAALSRICEAISTLSQASASVVVIVIPAEWSNVERVEVNGARKDLHDHVKAFAAPRGIRTQLIREATFDKSQRLEVIWWLALALYAKSNRTPWTLDAQDDGTVHIGIGYGLDHSDSMHRVVMCCSHIYQAAGLGLRFQLSEIGAPEFMRRKNPFLKREDAFRVGERALQVVFEARHSMPRRVCIAKRTPFTRAEQEGFCSALESVPEVELLSVEMESGARLVRADKEGVNADAFPVRRGTIVPYGEKEALLWVHGDTTGISSKYGGAHYFQGKSRIPAPLRLTRFCGSAPLEEIAADLLALSKMDWNSFDLYGKMPVHLSSPGRIARVARLLGNIRLEDRDYRLFM